MTTFTIEKVRLFREKKTLFEVMLSQHTDAMRSTEPVALLVVKLFTLMMVDSERAGYFLNEVANQLGQGHQAWLDALQFGNELGLGQYDAQLRSDFFQAKFNAVMEPLLEALQAKFGLSDQEITEALLNALP